MLFRELILAYQQACTRGVERYDGYVVFPISAAGGLLFTTAIAVVLLKERLNRLSFVGVGIAVGALGLLQPPS